MTRLTQHSRKMIPTCLMIFIEQDPFFRIGFLHYKLEIMLRARKICEIFCLSMRG